MNLYFLVEGRRTEKKVYARWLAHTFPALSQVHGFAQVEDDQASPEISEVALQDIQSYEGIPEMAGGEASYCWGGHKTE